MESNQEQYDVIVIGSGMGGLTVASLLAQMQGKRVLILEQHYVVGGFTHTFKREKGYHWDVGIHYVGDLEEGHQFRRLFDYTTSGGVRWKKMPYIYDKFVFPDFTFEAPSSLSEFKQKVKLLFPDELEGIDRYFRDVIVADSWYRKNITYKHLPEFLKPFMKPSAKAEKLATMSTRAYLDLCFKSEKIKGMLTSQWGNYGAVPFQSSFANHAMVVRHFFKGGYYPIGSSKTIAESIVPIVENAGGSVRVNHEVQEIIVENGTAVGVVANRKQGKNKTEVIFKAPIVVSCAGAYLTYTKLIPEAYRGSISEDIKNHPDGLAHLCLYIGFKSSPEKLGFKGENHWIFDEYNHDEMFRDTDAVVHGRMKMAFLSFPSLKDPAAKAHTGEIITFVSYDTFKNWETSPWKKRGEDYEAFKQRLANDMLAFIENKYPGFTELVDFYELSTPLTTTHFTKHPRGWIYGMLTTPDKFSKPWNHVKTPVKNLFLTGTDAAVLGVAGAFTGGIFSTLEIMGGKLGLWYFLKLERVSQAFARKLKAKGIKTVED
jgi:all-trans-retinol 13,14-reductase